MTASITNPDTRSGKRRGAKRSPKSSAPRPDALPSKPYEPTAKEMASLAAFENRREEAKPAPSLKILEKDGGYIVSVDHPNQLVGHRLMMDSLGLVGADAANAIITQIVNIPAVGGKIEATAANDAMALVQSIGPRDTVEAMLAVQMVAIHNATVAMARKLNHVENVQQQDSRSNALNKLARTFATQMEALNRHRGKGQQKVTVEHVTVNAGGQAIVGAVNTPPGGHAKTEAQAHANQATHPSIPALPSPDAQRDAMPIPGGEGQTAMQDARRG